MTRELILELSDFSRETLEREAERHRLAVATLLARSAQYYLLEQSSERLSTRVPEIAPGRGRDGRTLRVRIDLRDGEWRDLEEAASREEVSLEHLFEHAAFLFVADFESGRVAERLVASSARPRDGRFRRER